MRTSPFFLAVLSLFIFLVACSSSSSDKKTEVEDDMANIPFTRSVSIDTTLVMINKAMHFDTWKASFASSQSLMKDNGLEHIQSFRGLNDSNLTITLSEVKNLSMAERFTNSSEMLNSTEAANDQTQVEALFLDQQLEYTKATNDTLIMLMAFKTVDYDRWEEAFLDDYREDATKDFEVIRVFRGLRDREMVYMMFKVNDPGYVEKMEKNNAFRMKMLASGVVSYPVTYKLLPAEV